MTAQIMIDIMTIILFKVDKTYKSVTIETGKKQYSSNRLEEISTILTVLLNECELCVFNGRDTEIHLSRYQRCRTL